MVGMKINIIIKLLQIKLRKSFLSNRKKIRAYQLRKFRKHQKLLQESEFYHLISKQQLNLNHYPVIGKTIFMEKFDQINTVDIKKQDAIKIATGAEKSRNFSSKINDITIGLSSGTSGNKGVFLASSTERALWVAAILDRVISFKLKKRKIAFFLRANSTLYESVKSVFLKFHYFDLLLPFKVNYNSLCELNPDILVAPPSVLMQIAQTLSYENKQLTPEKVISVAEVLEPQDKNYLEKIFEQTIHQVYQCTEGFLASTCKYGVLHFNEDFLIIEKKIIDLQSSRFHPVITDLYRISQPIIRYELNDIIIPKSSCKCNSPFLAIEMIEGRSDDVFIFANEDNEQIEIYPDFFRRCIILSSDYITNYQLIQYTPNLLVCFIEVSQNLEQIQLLIKKNILDFLDSQQIKNVSLEFINTLRIKPGDKLKRVINEYRKTI
jgi:putative adenylate-forming enzyme